MSTDVQKFYVVRDSRIGLSLAEVVSRGSTHAVIRRLIGQKFRMGRQKRAKCMTVPLANVVREATERELVLGYPV